LLCLGFVFALTLPLGMPGVGTDNPDHAFAFDHTAVVAPGFYRCCDFHDYCSLVVWLNLMERAT
jgi:hypothetical protein